MGPNFVPSCCPCLTMLPHATPLSFDAPPYSGHNLISSSSHDVYNPFPGECLPMNGEEANGSSVIIASPLITAVSSYAGSKGSIASGFESLNLMANDDLIVP